MIERRRIYRIETSNKDVLSELLQTMFTAELLSDDPNPREIWIVSPWITNIEVFDNRANHFSYLNLDWSNTIVRLVSVLLTLAKNGKEINIVTRDDSINNDFISKLKKSRFPKGSLNIIYREKLHIKGIVLQKSLLDGSMNLTFSGIAINEEKVTYQINPDEVAEARIEYSQYKKNI